MAPRAWRRSRRSGWTAGGACSWSDRSLVRDGAFYPKPSMRASERLAFYAARGFVEVDRRPRYYRDGSTAVVMRRQLGGCG